MTNKTILLVDDESILLMALRQSLRLHFGSSYRYETSLCGEEALERIGALTEEGAEIALVISDWLMPGMKGDELLARVHARHPSIKLIMLTGHADESDMEKLAAEVNIAAFIRKPWSSKELFETVSGVLR
jgi:CheY-like chemotaxis protein